MNDLYVHSEDKKYLHYFNWENYRQEFSWNNPRQKGHFRIDLELAQSESKLPNFWYACDEWVAIDLHEGLTHPNGKESLRVIVESSHEKGERMVIYSTFSCLWPEPWGRNKPEIWVFFKSKMWNITSIYWMMGHEWKFRVAYPLVTTNYKHNNWNYQEKSYDREDFLPETFSREPIDLEIAGFLESIYANPKEEINWLVLADWLQEKQDPLADFIRENIKNIHKLNIHENVRRPRNYRTLTLAVLRLIGLNVKHPGEPMHTQDVEWDAYWGRLNTDPPPDKSLIAV